MESSWDDVKVSIRLDGARAITFKRDPLSGPLQSDDQHTRWVKVTDDGELTIVVEVPASLRDTHSWDAMAFQLTLDGRHTFNWQCSWSDLYKHREYLIETVELPGRKPFLVDAHKMSICTTDQGLFRFPAFPKDYRVTSQARAISFDHELGCIKLEMFRVRLKLRYLQQSEFNTTSMSLSHDTSFSRNTQPLSSNKTRQINLEEHIKDIPIGKRYPKEVLRSERGARWEFYYRSPTEIRQLNNLIPEDQRPIRRAKLPSGPSKSAKATQARSSLGTFLETRAHPVDGPSKPQPAQRTLSTSSKDSKHRDSADSMPSVDRSLLERASTGSATGAKPASRLSPDPIATAGSGSSMHASAASSPCAGGYATDESPASSQSTRGSKTSERLFVSSSSSDGTASKPPNFSKADLFKLWRDAARKDVLEDSPELSAAWKQFAQQNKPYSAIEWRSAFEKSVRPLWKQYPIREASIENLLKIGDVIEATTGKSLQSEGFQQLSLDPEGKYLSPEQWEWVWENVVRAHWVESAKQKGSTDHDKRIEAYISGFEANNTRQPASFRVTTMAPTPPMPPSTHAISFYCREYYPQGGGSIAPWSKFQGTVITIDDWTFGRLLPTKQNTAETAEYKKWCKNLTLPQRAEILWLKRGTPVMDRHTFRLMEERQMKPAERAARREAVREYTAEMHAEPDELWYVERRREEDAKRDEIEMNNWEVWRKKTPQADSDSEDDTIDMYLWCWWKAETLTAEAIEKSTKPAPKKNLFGRTLQVRFDDHPETVSMA